MVDHVKQMSLSYLKDIKRSNFFFTQLRDGWRLSLINKNIHSKTRVLNLV